MLHWHTCQTSAEAPQGLMASRIRTVLVQPILIVVRLGLLLSIQMSASSV